MSQVDTSIYNNLQPVKVASPFENAAMLAQIQNGQNSNKLAQLQFSQAQQAQSDRNALADAYRGAVGTDGAVDYNKLIPGLAAGGQGAQVPAVMKQKLDYEKAAREAEKAQLEGHLQKINALGQIMGGVKDQASYDMAKQQAAQIFGPDFVAQIPPQYDPAFIQQKQQEAMTVADQLGQKWKQLDYSLNVDKFGYQQKNDAANRGVTIRGQDIGANTAAAGRAVTLRGQDLTNARANESNQIKLAQTKPLTEVQGKAALFGARAEEADKILRDLEGKYSRTGLAAKVGAEGTWGIGGALGAVGNAMLSPEAQKADQAQRDFVNAVLRQESGAAISQGEFNNARIQYFPQPGDTPSVVAQKARNRKTAIEGFKNVAGKGAYTAPSVESSGGVPAGVDPALWQHMTPQERALWQK